MLRQVSPHVCSFAGVLLGDIKPANFMLASATRDPLAAIEAGQLGGPSGWLRAVDFGCSQAVGERPLCRRTGTPVYMSPETFRREYHLEAE
jgi:calcium-dependent protein kinase